MVTESFLSLKEFLLFLFINYIQTDSILTKYQRLTDLQEHIGSRVKLGLVVKLDLAVPPSFSRPGVA